MKIAVNYGSSGQRVPPIFFTRRREDAKKKKEEKSGSKQETVTKFEVRKAKGENFTLPTSPSTFGARRPPATACATSGKAFRLLLRVFAASRANCPRTPLPESLKKRQNPGGLRVDKDRDQVPVHRRVPRGASR
jgi:hypothetical protein